jgi:hypothetical protein
VDSRWGSALVATTIVAAACGEPTAPVVQATLDDAIFHAQLADPLSAPGAAALGFPVVRTAIRRDDATLTRTYELLDEAGVRQNGWNDRVATIRIVITYVDDSTSWRDEATLTGLQSGQQRLTGTATASWTRGSEQWTGRRTTDLIILSRVVMPGIFPTGSVSLRAELAGAAGGGGSRSRSIALSYDGTSTVSMLSSFDGAASLSCTFDLLSPDATRGCQ